MDDKPDKSAKTVLTTSPLGTGLLSSIESLTNHVEASTNPIFNPPALNILGMDNISKILASPAFKPLPVFGGLSSALSQIALQQDRWAGMFGTASLATNSFHLAESHVMKALNVSERFQKLAIGLPQHNFGRAFSSVAVVAVAKGLRSPEMGAAFDQVHNLVEETLAEEPLEAEHRDLEAQYREVLSVLVELQQKSKIQKVRWYLGLLISLLLFVFNSYLTNQRNVGGKLDKMDAMLRQIQYDNHLENSGELVTNAILREVRYTRLPAKLRNHPMSNGGVSHHLSKGQEVVVIYRAKKYLFVALSDQGELYTGFVLKKHLVLQASFKE